MRFFSLTVMTVLRQTNTFPFKHHSLSPASDRTFHNKEMEGLPTRPGWLSVPSAQGMHLAEAVDGEQDVLRQLSSTATCGGFHEYDMKGPLSFYLSVYSTADL